MKLFIYVVPLFFFFTFSVKAEEIFNPSTGEIHWNINDEVQLEYIPTCWINHNSIHEMESPLHNFFSSIDVFSILGTKFQEKHLDCGDLGFGARGLKVNYRLREEEIFPESYDKDILINGHRLKYYSYDGVTKKTLSSSELYFKDIHIVLFNESYKDYTENFQKIYSAIQTKNEVIVTIKQFTGYHYNDKTGTLERVYNTEDEYQIHVSNLDKADAIHKEKLGLVVDELNLEVRQQYKYIILYYFFLVISLLIAYCVWKSKIYPLLKKWINFLFNYATSFSFKRNKNIANILKKEGLSSYSVADELLKWAKLKDEGIISEEEFYEARNKIMGKSR